MKKKAAIYLFLHFLLMLMSLSGVCSKLASTTRFFSMEFCLCYGGILFILGLYGVGWQQVVKRLPLISAYSHRAVTIVWGIIWGKLLFGEQLTIGKLIGAILIICGVVLFAEVKEK